jgi:hypothetical protein
MRDDDLISAVRACIHKQEELQEQLYNLQRMIDATELSDTEETALVRALAALEAETARTVSMVRQMMRYSPQEEEEEED